jgi:hypothetical protein
LVEQLLREGIDANETGFFSHYITSCSVGGGSYQDRRNAA